MAKQYIDIEIEGEEKIILALERLQDRQQKELRELVDELASFSAFWLISHVPVYDTYLMRHIDRDGPVWYPGGAGGGGEWRAVVGIKEGTSRHPLYVEQGTGIYAGKGLIWASGVKGLTGRYQKVMRFQKHGEPPKFRYWIRGQRPQQYFYITWRSLNAFAVAKMAARRALGD
jgi:hypothetical protein